jgi:hypothetical protein
MAILWRHRGNFEIGFETPGGWSKEVCRPSLIHLLLDFNYKRKLGLLKGNFHFATIP